jgi:hypothetical protein
MTPFEGDISVEIQWAGLHPFAHPLENVLMAKLLKAKEFRGHSDFAVSESFQENVKCENRDLIGNPAARLLLITLTLFFGSLKMHQGFCTAVPGISNRSSGSFFPTRVAERFNMCDFAYISRRSQLRKYRGR